MLFSIITVCFNSAKTIRQTFDSVLQQRCKDYEYIVVDGASTDGTVDIIKEYEPKFEGRMRWISEPDKGIYDAVRKGFAMSSGEILAWIGSDDVYMPNAFKVVCDVFRQYPQVEWLTGETLHIFSNGTLCNAALGRPWQYYEFCMGRAFWVQQETTFWRRSLWEANRTAFGDLRYAGDYALWTSFARTTQLYALPVLLAAFRLRSGQTSAVHMDEYKAEVEQICRKELSTVSWKRRMAWRLYCWVKNQRFLGFVVRRLERRRRASMYFLSVNMQTQKIELP